MARPKKLTLDFLIHDAYASSDTKIRRLERRHKNEGYAVFFKFLERLCREDGMRLDLSDPGDQELLADDFYMRDTTHLLAIVKDCVEVGLFDKQLWESERVIFSQGLYQRYLDRLREREAAAKRKQDSIAQQKLKQRIEEIEGREKVVTCDNPVSSGDNSPDTDTEIRSTDPDLQNTDTNPKGGGEFSKIKYEQGRSFSDQLLMGYLPPWRTGRGVNDWDEEACREYVSYWQEKGKVVSLSDAKSYFNNAVLLAKEGKAEKFENALGRYQELRDRIDRRKSREPVSDAWTEPEIDLTPDPEAERQGLIRRLKAKANIPSNRQQAIREAVAAGLSPEEIGVTEYAETA